MKPFMTSRDVNLIVFQVSIVSFVLRHTDMVMQARREDDFILSAQIQGLDIVEHGNIGLETFQTKFASGKSPTSHLRLNKHLGGVIR